MAARGGEEAFKYIGVVLFFKLGSGCVGTYFIIVTETARIYSTISLLLYFILKIYSKVCCGGAEGEWEWEVRWELAQLHEIVRAGP